MTFLQSIILGFIQGITEFLPISSSAHLVIVPYILGWDLDPGVAFIFDVLVQVATLAAVIIFFWNDMVNMAKFFFLGIKTRQPLKEPYSRMAWLVILATLPAGIIGFLIKDLVEAAFGSPLFVSLALLFTALILALAERYSRPSKSIHQATVLDAVIIGLAQAAAIFPGISRSGSTISASMGRQIHRSESARFSFLLSIPIMLAAGLLASLDFGQLPNLSNQVWIFLPGMVVAGLTGYFSIRWLLKYLTHRSLYVFSIYCALVGFLVLVVYLIRS